MGPNLHFSQAFWYLGRVVVVIDHKSNSNSSNVLVVSIMILVCNNASGNKVLNQAKTAFMQFDYKGLCRRPKA